MTAAAREAAPPDGPMARDDGGRPGRSGAAGRKGTGQDGSGSIRFMASWAPATSSLRGKPLRFWAAL
ncbi:hypothetical protein amrb99_34490 [Actinomadura sp. RB99]|nr:hypothetical protein [Actinomadura sp. RB99]